jgi:hypothetical protein
MTEYGTIKIPREDYERHNERRENLGQTWAAYIDGQSPNLPNSAEIDTEDLATQIVDHIGVEGSRIQVDNSKIARAVSRDLDYTHLAEKVSERVLREMGNR